MFSRRNIYGQSVIYTKLPIKEKILFLLKLTVEQQSFNKMGYCIIASKADKVILINSSDAVGPRNIGNYYEYVFAYYQNTTNK